MRNFRLLSDTQCVLWGRMKNTTQSKAEAAYLEAYRRAMKALKDIENMIHEKPAPGGETEINWGHVGDMLHIAAELEELTSNE